MYRTTIEQNPLLYIYKIIYVFRAGNSCNFLYNALYCLVGHIFTILDKFNIKYIYCFSDGIIHVA